jgi:hypothetical protein
VVVVFLVLVVVVHCLMVVVEVVQLVAQLVAHWVEVVAQMLLIQELHLDVFVFLQQKTSVDFHIYLLEY